MDFTNEPPSSSLTKLYHQFDHELRIAKLTPVTPAVLSAAVKLSLWSEAAGSVAIEKEDGDLHAIAAQANSLRSVTTEKSIQAAINASRALSYITATHGPGSMPSGKATAPNYVQEIHHIAMNKLLPPEKLGEWRTNEAAVETPDGKTLIEGSKPSEINSDMKAWSTKYDPSRDEHHPLYTLAMAHAEFELIHPFADGNGRTGRLIFQAMALERDLPMLPISKLLDQHRLAYFSTLNKAQTAHQHQDWLRFIGEAAIHSIRHQARIMPALSDFITHTRAAAGPILGADKSTDLALELASQPIFSTAAIAKRLNIPEPKLQLAIAALQHQKAIGQSHVHSELFAISPLTLASKPYMVPTPQQETQPRHAR